MTVIAASKPYTRLEISHFTSNPQSSNFCTGTLTCCSNNGIGFLSPRKFSKDAAVYIRVKPGAAPGEMAAKGLRSAALAQVQWSQSVPSGIGQMFETRAKYLR